MKVSDIPPTSLAIRLKIAAYTAANVVVRTKFRSDSVSAVAITFENENSLSRLNPLPSPRTLLSSPPRDERAPDAEHCPEKQCGDDYSNGSSKCYEETDLGR